MPRAGKCQKCLLCFFCLGPSQNAVGDDSEAMIGPKDTRIFHQGLKHIGSRYLKPGSGIPPSCIDIKTGPESQTSSLVKTSSEGINGCHKNQGSLVMDAGVRSPPVAEGGRRRAGALRRPPGIAVETASEM